MRILYHALVEIELPDGHAIHTHEVCSNLARLGHDVVLLCPRPRSPLPFKPEYRIIGMPFFGFMLHRKIVHFLFSFFYLLGWTLYFKPHFIIDKNTPLNPFPAIVSRLLGTPLIVEINGYSINEIKDDSRYFRAAYTTIERANFAVASRVIAVSPFLVEKYLEHYRLDAGKFYTMDNGVAEHFFPAFYGIGLREHIGLPQDKFIMGYVGSFNPDHDIDTMLEAIALLKEEGLDVYGVFVGRGVQRDGAIARAAGLGLAEVTDFPGPAAYEDVPAYMAAFDCGVVLMKPGRLGALASVMKLKEYLAVGVPVITNKFPKEDAGIGPFVLQAGVEDAAAVADTAKLILKDTASARETALAGRHFVERRYSWKNTAAQIEEILTGRGR